MADSFRTSPKERRSIFEWTVEFYVFDVKFDVGTSGAIELDSGAGVNVWPKGWWNEAKMEQKIPGLKMVAANGTEIANLGQTVIRFNTIKPADFAGQPTR